MTTDHIVTSSAFIKTCPAAHQCPPVYVAFNTGGSLPVSLSYNNIWDSLLVLRNWRSWSDGNGNGNVQLAPLTNNKPSADGCSTVVLKWDGRIGLHGLVWMDGMVFGCDEVSSKTNI